MWNGCLQKIPSNRTYKRFAVTRNPLSSAVWTGLEPATPCVTGRYSNQLNYHTIFVEAQWLLPICECKDNTCFLFPQVFCEKNRRKCDFFIFCEDVSDQFDSCCGAFCNLFVWPDACLDFPDVSFL